MNPIAIEVLGLPQPAGSKRGFAMARKGEPIVKNGKFNGRTVITDDNPKSRDWKTTVSLAADQAMAKQANLPFAAPLLQGPLELRVVFRIPRIKGHFRENGELKANAPTYHMVRPDCTKLLRGIEDALTGIVWRDDSQVAKQSAEKVYAGPIFHHRTDHIGNPAGWFQIDGEETKIGATITITALQSLQDPKPQREATLL